MYSIVENEIQRIVSRDQNNFRNETTALLNISSQIVEMIFFLIP